MNNLSPTKRSFVRGVGQLLQQAGQTKFASTELLRQACDKTASVMQTEPVQRDENDNLHAFRPTDQEVAKVAQELIQISNYVEKQGYKTAAYPPSVSLNTPEEAYGDIIVEVRQKIAAEATIGMTGEREYNRDANTAKATAEGKKEVKERPAGYANTGIGNNNFSEPQAARVGTEQPHPGQEGNVKGPASNSVVAATKTSSIAETLAKIAMGTTITSTDPNQQNTQVNSPQAETVQDQMERPEGTYANVGQGNANFSEPAPVHVGVEVQHPKVESGVQGASSNSVTEASGTGGGGAPAAESAPDAAPILAPDDKTAAYMQQVAQRLMPVLPQTMGSSEKIATVQTFCQTTPALREAYLRDVYATHNTPFPE